jgi:hypothetical protein
MKRTSIVIFSLFFLFFVKPVFAQYNGISIPTQSITPNPSPSTKIVSYDLPYPGILPGSPVYSIKLLRDKIVELMTGDPLRRTAFYLLQADKRLSASLLLFDSGNH